MVAPGEQTCWEEAGPPLCRLHAEPHTCSATRVGFAQTAVGPYLSFLSSSSPANSRGLTKELVSFQRTPHFPHSPLIHSLTAGLFTHIWPPVVTAEAVDVCPCLTRHGSAHARVGVSTPMATQGQLGLVGIAACSALGLQLDCPAIWGPQPDRSLTVRRSQPYCSSPRRHPQPLSGGRSKRAVISGSQLSC